MEMMNYIKEFIKPELLIVIPVLYFIGMGLKKAEFVSDKYIPFILGTLSVILSIIYISSTNDITNYKSILTAVFTAITQGILCAGASVYINQLIKQGKK